MFNRFLAEPRRLLGLLVVPAVLLFFAKMVFTNLILARGDTFLYFYPYWQAAARALFEEGRIPLWNDSLFMGTPFLANSQVGLFYPLNWPLWALLPTPYAMSASVVLHVLIAAEGTYLAARRCLALPRPESLLAALLFALGGYLTAQVEHINQLQGLAWLPWYFALLGEGWVIRPERLRVMLVLSVLMALQLTAGHTQTLFITAVGVLVWLLLQSRRLSVQAVGRTVLTLLLPAGWLALLLAAAQLSPTLELLQHSSRQGGLLPNEVLSFSLHPLLLTRSLLPHIGQSLFTEYVAFLPLTALLLAGVGAWQWRDRPGILPLLALALFGLFLALGRFNGLYLLLARLPGFDLFRVPARWLVLYAFAVALLAAAGLHSVRQGGGERRLARPVLLGAALLLLLMLWGWLAVPLVRWLPLGAEVAAEAPGRWTMLAWLLELGLAVLLLLCRPVLSGRFPLLAALSLLVLFLASRSLPYNNLTAPAAYTELRPAVARLLSHEEGVGPPGRLLSLSDIFFDLGDAGEIATIFGDSLTEEALFDYIVATKHKEVLSPNLPLTYNLASVDGFDGGLLPLRDYALLVSLLLPAGAQAPDGRLREYLDAVPPARWLDLFNAQYLITDKVGDEWHQGVFFDRQHPAVLSSGERSTIGYIPPYEATALWVLGTGSPGPLHLEDTQGQTHTLLPEPAGERLWRVVFPRPLTPTMLELRAGEAGWQVEGLALVDERDGSFQTLVPGQYRLLLSGDVKLYENLDVMPRAFLVSDWTWAADVEAAVAEMARPEFNPRTTAVLLGQGDAPSTTTTPTGSATITEYRPESITLHTSSPTPALLVLSDTYYPGWQATIDGTPAEILQANALFRGVFVPAGEHEVEFVYRPVGVTAGVILSLVGLVLWVALAVWVGRMERRFT